MKKKYIVPMVDITSCYLGHALLAGSDPSQDPNYVIGDKEATGGGVKEVTDEDKPILGAKGFDAWSSWDE